MMKREPVIRIEYLDWVYRQPLRLPLKAVLAYLVRRGDRNGYCWPEQRRIATDLGTSTRTVIRCLRVLRLCGLVKVVRQEKRRDGQAGVKNRYRLNYAVNVTPETAQQVEAIARKYFAKKTPEDHGCPAWSGSTTWLKDKYPCSPIGGEEEVANG